MLFLKLWASLDYAPILNLAGHLSSMTFAIACADQERHGKILVSVGLLIQQVLKLFAQSGLGFLKLGPVHSFQRLLRVY